MVSWFKNRQFSPIGVDIGSRSVKLIQFCGDRSDIWEAARCDLPGDLSADPAQRDVLIAETIRKARQGRNFRGRAAVICLSGRELFVQNIRVAQAEGAELQKLIHAEAANRIPFPPPETELRYLEAADVRQGDVLRREVILLACRRASVARLVAISERSGLAPAAIDVEPAALIRCYHRQFRRDQDQQARIMFVNVGAASTSVVIGKGPEVVFVKYLDLGGRHLDEAVARHLKMELPAAASLRRNDGDRRADQRNQEVVRSISESVRPVLEHLTNEISLCVRYHSVTFRGQPLSRIVLSGGEASPMISEWIASRSDLPCEVGNPLRSYRSTHPSGRASQWDVAAGLALREVGG